MFIKDIFASKKPVLSFEVFPPKKESGLETVKSAIKEMSALPIDYMSVTYGAGGSNSKNTASVASYMKDTLSIPALAHLTCVTNTKEDIRLKLDEYRRLGIENILALRGDKPADYDGEIFPGYRYASELTAAIKEYGASALAAHVIPSATTSPPPSAPT